MTQKRPTRSGPIVPVDPDIAVGKLRALWDGISALKGQAANSPEFRAWSDDVTITLSRFYGADSEEYARFDSIRFAPGVRYPGQPNSEFVAAFDRGVEQARLFLASRIEDWRPQHSPIGSERKLTGNPTDVFVVHGHDHGMKETVARFLSKLKLNPIILHEQADEGNTIIEKFEKHAEVSFAVAIFSGDDLGAAQRDVSAGRAIEQSVRPRARQNVVFEFGYFVGALGRKNVVAIVENGVETPSDYSGVLYVPYDAEDGWRIKLVRELKAAGLSIDANAAF
jgi:predicted nucleotide-binding protein